MIIKSLEERLIELTERLNNLTVQQEEVNTRVAHARIEVAVITEAIRADQERQSEREEAVEGSGYYIGEVVTIINPTAGQERYGVITGRTRDNLLKIKPKSGKGIRRLPKNVRRT